MAAMSVRASNGLPQRTPGGGIFVRAFCVTAQCAEDVSAALTRLGTEANDYSRALATTRGFTAIDTEPLQLVVTDNGILMAMRIVCDTALYLRQGVQGVRSLPSWSEIRFFAIVRPDYLPHLDAVQAVTDAQNIFIKDLYGSRVCVVAPGPLLTCQAPTRTPGVGRLITICSVTFTAQQGMRVPAPPKIAGQQEE